MVTKTLSLIQTVYNQNLLNVLLLNVAKRALYNYMKHRTVVAYFKHDS